MKTLKKSLQKFTESEQKINRLLELTVITRKDVQSLNSQERGLLNGRLNEMASDLKGQERDQYLLKIDEIITGETRNILWENNNLRIIHAITNHINSHGIMPNRGQLAETTGLSRQTLHNHFKDYSKHPLFLEQVEEITIMKRKILSKVYQYAINGDVRACKIYLEMVGGFEPQQRIGVQNNYIQINNTVISQDQLKLLKPDQLNEIEKIFSLTLNEI